MTTVDSVRAPGQVWGQTAADAAGPAFVTSYDGRNLSTTVVTALDPATGRLLWRREFPGHPYPPRVSESGTVWARHRDPSRAIAVTELDANGTVVRSVMPEHEPHEHLGALVLLPDGFCIVWMPADRYHVIPPGATARVARHRIDGATFWSTPLPLADLHHPGVVEMGVHTGWEIRPKAPWRPQTIEPHHWDPLLVAGDRVLAGINGSGGIGVCSLLDLATGELIAATEPAPYGYKAVAGADEFLVGRQGYGAFSTDRYDRTGQVTRTWPSHGMWLVDRHAHVRGPESINSMSAPQRFRLLDPDGTVRDGPLLSGYYTTYPALDANGNAVFWRHGQLTVIDAGLRERVVFARDDDRPVMSRILLLHHGQVVFTLHDEIVIVRDTGQAELDGGSWPCGDGNLRGNPAVGVEDVGNG